MRKVNRDDWQDLPDKLKHPDTIKAMEALANDATIEVSDSIYKDPYKKDGRTKSRVRDKLNEYYHHKCAYCETGGGKADIEHYRPKGSVKEEDTHSGYYWLAYEWSNLIPSCVKCSISSVTTEERLSLMVSKRSPSGTTHNR